VSAAHIVRLAFVAIAAAGLATSTLWRSSADESAIPSFAGNSGWLNTAPLTAADLRGKIVLVDFWEYTCVNCLRTLPYLRNWYAKYHDAGFTIVGVHSPEFAFAGESQNVAAAAKRLEVTWPVVLDDNFNLWKRYRNDGWPHEYLYDRNGNLVDSVSGEGHYPETEAKIQALVRQSDSNAKLPPIMALLPQDSYDKPGAVCYPITPEIVLERTRVANATALNRGSQETNYIDDPSAHRDGSIYLQGYWRGTPEAMISASSDGYLILPYRAIQVVSVMKPDAGGSTRVDVSQDGRPIARAEAGSDLRYDAGGASYVAVDAPRAYELVNNARYAQHELKLAPQRYGVGVYSFAFESCEAGSSTK
jgi:thiol-disulfide isomerase/thioredoxin